MDSAGGRGRPMFCLLTIAWRLADGTDNHATKAGVIYADPGDDTAALFRRHYDELTVRAQLDGAAPDGSFAVTAFELLPAALPAPGDAELAAAIRAQVPRDWEADDGYCADAHIVAAIHGLLWEGPQP